MYAISAKGSSNRAFFVEGVNVGHDEIRWSKTFDGARKFKDKPSALEVCDYLLERGIHGVQLHYITKPR
jgi:hypothetical protein